MKHSAIILLLLLFIAVAPFAAIAGEPASAPLPAVKAIELKAVPGKRENISIEGEYAGFRCLPGNSICFWKIVTETFPKEETLTCGYNSVDPELFPAIFEPEKVYLGVYDKANSLRIIEVKRIDMIKCDESGTEVIVSPRINLDF